MKHSIYFYGIVLLFAMGCGKAVNADFSQPAGIEATNGQYGYSEAEEDGYASTSSAKSAAEGFSEVDKLDDGRGVAPVNEVKIPDKIIKTANISVQVEDYRESLKKVRTAVTEWKAYISSENEVNYSYRTGNTIIIRVPSGSFEQLIDAILEGEGKVISKSINSHDVSEEYVDIVTRLKNKKEVEKRYLELLNQARTIEEILRVENQVRTIREEIESKEGRLKFLNDRVSFSTITLDLYEEHDSWLEPSFSEKASTALGEGWEGFKILLIGLLYLWPLWFILLTGLVILIVLLKRKKKRKAK